MKSLTKYINEAMGVSNSENVEYRQKIDSVISSIIDGTIEYNENDIDLYGDGFKFDLTQIKGWGVDWLEQLDLYVLNSGVYDFMERHGRWEGMVLPNDAKDTWVWWDIDDKNRKSNVATIFLMNTKDKRQMTSVLAHELNHVFHNLKRRRYSFTTSDMDNDMFNLSEECYIMDITSAVLTFTMRKIDDEELLGSVAKLFYYANETEVEGFLDGLYTKMRNMKEGENIEDFVEYQQYSEARECIEHLRTNKNISNEQKEMVGCRIAEIIAKYKVIKFTKDNLKNYDLIVNYLDKGVSKFWKKLIKLEKILDCNQK